MIPTIKPYGCINESLPKYKFELDGKCYLYDRGFNKYVVDKAVYERLDIPLWDINEHKPV